MTNAWLYSKKIITERKNESFSTVFATNIYYLMILLFGEFLIQTINLYSKFVIMKSIWKGMDWIMKIKNIV